MACPRIPCRLPLPSSRTSILRLPRRPEEERKAYCLRRARALRGHPSRQWSHSHALACLRWYSHLQRHPKSWPAIAMDDQNADWVNERRYYHESASTLRATSRTGTRLERGRVFRWDQHHWTTACNPEGTNDQKTLSNLAFKLLRHHGIKIRFDI